MATHNKPNKYQDYIDKINDKNESNDFYIQHIRILKNDFEDDQTFALKTKFRLNKIFLTKMISVTDPTFMIMDISESWLGEKILNEDNMNDGILQWFIKLKGKINLKKLDYIGGNDFFGMFDKNISSELFQSYPTLVNFTSPSITPAYILRYDHQNNKYKVPIYIIIESKLHDKVWYESENSDVTKDEIYIYAKYYINHQLMYGDKNGIKNKKRDINYNYFIKNIILTNDGWYVNINIV